LELLVVIAPEAVGVAGESEDLGDHGKLSPPVGMRHLPAQQIHASIKESACDVIGGCRKPNKRFGKGIRFRPIGLIPHRNGSVHVQKRHSVNKSAEKNELFSVEA